MSQSQKKADHSTLLNRDKENQHNIGAIEMLQEALDNKVSKETLQESLADKVPKERKINGQALDKDVEIKNVESADKLSTSRNITLSGAVTATPTAFNGSSDVEIPISSLKEAYLEWGGRHNSVSISPVDVAMLPELNTNRLAFIDSNAVKFELSEDAGATWEDVSNDYDGTTLCTKSIDFNNGNTPTNQTINKRQRITIDCIKGNIYCVLAKIILNISTGGAGGCYCDVERGDSSENTVWEKLTTASIGGWSGWNAINLTPITVGTEKTTRYIRLTFSISSVNSSYYCNLSIISLRFVSSAFYSASNTMAEKGTLYDYDKDQNATFPKNLSISGNTLKIGSTTITETQLQALLALLK